MPEDEWRSFLVEGARTARWPPPGGRHAHVVPVWFVLDDDTVKRRSLRREPRVALCVDDERPPFTFVAWATGGRAE